MNKTTYQEEYINFKDFILQTLLINSGIQNCDILKIQRDYCKT